MKCNATAIVDEADGLVTYSCYRSDLSTDKPFVVDIEEDNEIVDRQLYKEHDAAMNEFERVVGIAIANCIQDYRKEV